MFLFQITVDVFVDLYATETVVAVISPNTSSVTIGLDSGTS